jgi:hypothetical protein
MTDAKEPDAQYGWEKGVTDLAAGLAGPDIIYESGGMVGSLIGCSLDSLVIDNETRPCPRRPIRIDLTSAVLFDLCLPLADFVDLVGDSGGMTVCFRQDCMNYELSGAWSGNRPI